MELKTYDNPYIEKKESCCNNSSCCGPSNTYVRDYSKVGRNEKCPCGSGFKFKKCCSK